MAQQRVSPSFLTIERPSEPFTPAPAPGSESTCRLYKDHLPMELGLHIRGKLHVTQAATLHEDGVLRLVKKLVVEIQSNKPQFSLTGPQLFDLARKYFQTDLTVTQPAVTVGDNSFELYLPIPFTVDEMNMLGVINPISFSTFNCRVEWGTVSEIITAGNATLTIDEATLYHFDIRRSAENLSNPALPVMLSEYRRMGYDTFAVDASGVVRVQLPTGNRIRNIMLTARANGVRSDSLIKAVRLEVDGGHPVTHKSAGALKAENQQRNQVANRTGVYHLDYDKARIGQGYLDLRGVTSAWLYVETDGAPPANSTLDVVLESLVPALR